MGELQQLLNIGPEVERHLYRIGIESRNDFLSQEPFDIFEKMLKINPALPKPLLASLVGAKENVPWYLVYSEVISEYEKLHPNHIWLKYQK